MNERLFYQAINEKSKSLGINPLLLLSGIEGLYTFRNMPLSTINYELLDSLILTIFALRIGDQFHAIAEENLKSTNSDVRTAAANELKEVSHQEVEGSANVYLKSFAHILAGKSTIRGYHEKALEVAAIEIEKMHHRFNNTSIGVITMDICKNYLSNSLDLASFFSN